jgi:hypothetical protein
MTSTRLVAGSCGSTLGTSGSRGVTILRPVISDMNRSAMLCKSASALSGRD